MEPFDLSLWKPFPRKTIIDAVTIDSRTIPSERTLFVALPGKRGHGHDHVEKALSKGASLALVESTWDAPESVQEARLIRAPSTLLALQSLAQYYRESLPNLEIVAVAGSCGKTMLKDLLSHILQEKDLYFSPESFNSQIGVALSILNIPQDARLAFIEMAATQPGEMERHIMMASPRYAIITNFYRRRLGSSDMKELVTAELQVLLSALSKDGFAIVEKNAIPSLKSPATLHFWNEKGVFQNYREELIAIATKAERLFGKSPQELSVALSSYRPEPSRTEIWKNALGTTFINLPYSKTPLSFAASLDEIWAYDAVTKPFSAGKTILFFEGLRNESHYHCSESLCNTIIQHGISDIFCWKKEVYDALSQKSHAQFALHFFPSFEDALSDATKTFGPHDTVIFKGEHTFSLERLMIGLEGSFPQTRVSINLAAISSNLELLKARLPKKTRIMVMVKALAYGTDDYRISHYLRSCGIDILGVSYVDEGVRLRQQGDKQAIFVIHASENEMKKAHFWNLEVGISTLEQVHAAKKAVQEAGKGTLKVHLHLDTGMKRFGCTPEKALELAREITSSPELEFEGLFTHFAVADDEKEDSFTHAQANMLHVCLEKLKEEERAPRYSHACNSPGSIRFAFPHFTMVRIGLATYGFHSSKTSAQALELRPALSLVSTIAGFTEGKKGDTVSYGRTHIVKQEKARFAMLPIGYFDGLHRAYSGKASVRIRGKEAPIVGRICMDYTIVDVTHIPEATLGDVALFFGEDDHGTYLSPEELATAGGSITHELMACLGPRIQRIFFYDESLATR